MKVALVHFHLKTGGVTTVMRRQVSVLKQVCEPVVLTGERAGADMPCPVFEIPGLAYDRPGITGPSPEQTTGQIFEAIASQWATGCDLIHVHNPLLAKNRKLLQILKLLQTKKTVFLQVHDFAEDGRPEAYCDEPYPPDCHYGVINRRDHAILLNAGLKRSGLHYLPNPVPARPSVGGRSPLPLWLYPVRAIRRKNIGEAILLSLFLEKGARLAITQAPSSASDMISYLDWVAWVHDTKLPVRFEAGGTGDYNHLAAASAGMVTTSISEGFGMAFLEPWMAGKRVWGRRLKHICSDFEENGLDLSALYDQLLVPLEWIDLHRYQRRWQMAVAVADRAFGNVTVMLAENKITIEKFLGNGLVDFGMLDEVLQRQVLGRLIEASDAREQLVDLNPWLTRWQDQTVTAATMDRNRHIATTHYGLEAYGRQLLATYRQVVEEQVVHTIDKQALFRAFFRPEALPLLTWAPYET